MVIKIKFEILNMLGDISPNFLCTCTCNRTSIYPCLQYPVRWHPRPKQQLLPQYETNEVCMIGSWVGVRDIHLVEPFPS